MDELIMWIILAAALAVLEIATMAFVGLYFAVGALAGALVAWLGGSVAWQLLAFGATGLLLMLITRPVLKRKLESPAIATNVDRMVGKRGIVTIPVDNDANTGQIRVGTEFWTARTPDGSPTITLPADAKVEIIAVEGVTARVVPLETQ